MKKYIIGFIIGFVIGIFIMSFSFTRNVYSFLTNDCYNYPYFSYRKVDTEHWIQFHCTYTSGGDGLTTLEI